MICVAVLQDDRHGGRGSFGQIAPHNHDRNAGRAEIFLRAGKNQAALADVDPARSDVRRHVGHQRHCSGIRHRRPLCSFDGVVAAQVNVGSLSRKRKIAGTRYAHEPALFRRTGDAIREALLEFGHRLSSPLAGVDHVNGLAWQSQIHRHHGKLQAGPALQKDHRVVFGNAEMLAQAGFGGGVDAFIFRRAVAHLHDGHAAAMPIEQFFADAFQNAQRQRARPGVEIEDAVQSSSRSAHDVTVPFLATAE